MWPDSDLHAWLFLVLAEQDDVLVLPAGIGAAYKVRIFQNICQQYQISICLNSSKKAIVCLEEEVFLEEVTNTSIDILPPGFPWRIKRKKLKSQRLPYLTGKIYEDSFYVV